MFIYKGRIYRRKRYDTCLGCPIVFGECYKINCVSTRGKPHELFISRLFHDILEVFYAREIREAGK